MRGLHKIEISVVLALSLALTGCGKKDHGDDDGSDPAATDGAAEGGGDSVDPGVNNTGGDVGSDLATGCTGEEVLASLLNASQLKLYQLLPPKQAALLLSASRLPTERGLELSTAAQVTNKLNLTTEIGLSLVEAWTDDTNPAHDRIVATYGALPAGDRLSFVLFGNAFYLNYFGGAPNQDAVGAIGAMLDEFDLATTDPANGDAPVDPVDDEGRVIGIVAAIGTSICIN